jgi:hypothetical protein
VFYIYLPTLVLLLVRYKSMKGKVIPLFIMKGYGGGRGINLFFPWHYMALWSNLHWPAALRRETAHGGPRAYLEELQKIKDFCSVAKRSSLRYERPLMALRSPSRQVIILLDENY